MAVYFSAECLLPAVALAQPPSWERARQDRAEGGQVQLGHPSLFSALCPSWLPGLGIVLWWFFSVSRLPFRGSMSIPSPHCLTHLKDQGWPAPSAASEQLSSLQGFVLLWEQVASCASPCSCYCSCLIKSSVVPRTVAEADGGGKVFAP